MLNVSRCSLMSAAMVLLLAGGSVAIAQNTSPAKVAEKQAEKAKADKAAEKPADKAADKGADKAATAGGEKLKDDQLVKDFIHYVRIDRADLASQFGAALLAKVEAPYGTAAEGKGLTLEAFVGFVDASGEMARFEDATIRGQRSSTLADVSSKLARAYDAGKLAMARNVDSIQAAIGQLTGSQRARLLARERLVAAGEYATPLLVQAIERGGDLSKLAEIKQVLLDLGRQSVAPLAAALPGLPAASQETVLSVLAQIPSAASVPVVADMVNTGKTDSVKAAAAKAVAALTSKGDAAMTSSARYAALADAYAKKQDSLIAFPRDAMQPIWSYTSQTGLVATPVKTEVYFQTMAMKTAEAALKADGTNVGALTTWLASNLQRELDTPKEYKHPIYGEGKRDAMYYAVAAGPAAGQRILAKALDSKNTPLARKAIAAIEKTGGSATLTAEVDGRRPLLNALMYPSRRVQAEAALVLAQSQPQTTFDGAERVVPVLGSLIRDAATKYAVVLADSKERGDGIAGTLKGKGYTVLPVGRSLADVSGAIAETAGIDLIVLALPSGSTGESLKAIKSNNRLAATPVLAGLSAQGRLELGGTYDGDPLVRVTGDGFQPEQAGEAIKQLVTAAGGELSAEDVTAYQLKALAALRDLAVGGSTVFAVADATGPLTATLGKAKGELKAAIADTLSKIADKRAQVALMDAALNAKEAEQLTLMNKVADSAKKFGNMLDERQVKSLLELSGKGSDEQATAVAALIGSLNLDAGSITGLLTGSKK